MQAVARSSLSPLDIPVAQREFRRDNKSYEPDTITGTVSAPSSAANSPAPVDPTPLSPLSTPNCFDSSSSASPPSFPASSAPSSSAASAHEEILLLNNRYLLLECVEGSVSPQSQPLRRCIDTVTGTTYFCRECQRSEATASLLAAHNRLRDSDVVTPIYETISASLDDEQQNSSSSSKLYLISPASYGDLHTYLRSKRRLKESEARSLFRQAAQAVNDCHRHGVVLTDLKLRRFVFADPQRTQLRLESLEEAIVLERRDSDDGVWRKHGYPAYVTPEVLLSRGARYSGRAADLWSLGIILYTLLVGRYPFQDSGPFGLFTKIIRGHFAVPDFVSSRARCLIRNLLRRDPQQRLDAGDILQHPWFNAVLRTAKADQVKSKPEAPILGSGAASASVRSQQQQQLEPLAIVDQVVPETAGDSRMDE